MAEIQVLNLADPCDEWGETMLIEVVEGVEGPEVYAVPSLVRLELLQSCVQAVRHPLLGTDLVSQPPGEFLGFGRDRELGRVPIRRRIDLMNGDGQAIREMVKGLAKTVGDLPGEQRNYGVVRFFKDPKTTGDYLGLRIALIDNQASVTLRPPLLGGVERIEMFERPVELQPMATAC
jgi:hypothetical protein